MKDVDWKKKKLRLEYNANNARIKWRINVLKTICVFSLNLIPISIAIVAIYFGVVVDVNFFALFIAAAFTAIFTVIPTIYFIEMYMDVSRSDIREAEYEIRKHQLEPIEYDIT